MFSLILIAGGLIATVLVIAAMRPDIFSVSRSGIISAPPAAVFAEVNDFHEWDAWSPWARLDPACKNTFTGAPSGTGAVFAWSGNSKVGEGSMTITESRPFERILIELRFIKPFKATNTTAFTFAPDGAQTRVTWTMTGKNTLMSKVMSLFMNCDKIVGGQFEQGLASMKAVVETGAR